MIENIPFWVLALDYVLGMVMWTLIGRFAMGIFLPLLAWFAPITPKFLVRPMVPLFVAWFFFAARFYLLPWLLGYSVMGMLSFPLESEFAHGVAKLIGVFVD